ncbi:MAG TPA: hypothetical protein VNX21_04450 [Candidatus Thermoplasmatota archaeon]|nr:hypothetical protein [Candidatus Thermoplasmatota archaeon]
MRPALLLLLALAAPLAAAQDPDVNESDMDAEAPPADDAYLYEDEAADPTLDESDMDASVPPADESWLTTDADAGAMDEGAGEAEPRRSPGPALALLVAGVALAAAAVRRR